MKLNASITMLASSGNPGGGERESGVTIKLRDQDSRMMFAKITLTPHQFVSAMSRLGDVECDVEVFGLNYLGKIMEIDTFEFELAGATLRNKKELAKEIALRDCPDGWKPDLHFDSQNSIFYKGNDSWARTTIRRWIDKDEELND